MNQNEWTRLRGIGEYVARILRCDRLAQYNAFEDRRGHYEKN
jgi:hypothetical protein